MKSMFQLLTELSVDPFRLDDFIRDPNPLLSEAGLGPKDLPLLTQPERLSPERVWERCASCGDPGSDPLPDPDVPEPAVSQPSSVL